MNKRQVLVYYEEKAKCSYTKEQQVLNITRMRTRPSVHI